MNTTNINRHKTTNTSGVPPETPKTHQKAGELTQMKELDFIENRLFKLMDLASLAQNDALEKAHMRLMDYDLRGVADWLDIALDREECSPLFPTRVGRLKMFWRCTHLLVGRM